MRSAFGMTFDVPDGYLNTASIGIPPAESVAAVTEAVGRWGRGADSPGDFDPLVDRTRELFGRVVGVPGERVALGGSVSSLVGTVAASLPDGARVLLAAGEFTSVSFPFAAQADRGITATEAEPAALPELAAEYDLVAVSAVQSADGRCADFAALREATRDSGTRVLFDVTQAAGWLPLELDWADYVVGASYKFLMGPRGIAWLAVHPEAPRLRPVQANWYAGDPDEDTNYGLPLRLAPGARGLDVLPGWLACVGAAASLRALDEADPEQVRQHCTGLADDLRERLGLAPAGSAIVNVGSIGAVPGAEAAERLAAAGVRFSPRAGGCRLSFHLYNTADDVALVARALRV